MKDLASRAEKIVANAKTLVMSSIDENGFPATRALLAPRKRRGIKQLWHSTNMSSNKVSHFRANPNACVYFFEPDRTTGVMLRGTMKVLTDEESRRELWRTGDRRFYLRGVNDPDYCVLLFTADSGRLFRHGKSAEFDIV